MAVKNKIETRRLAISVDTYAKLQEVQEQIEVEEEKLLCLMEEWENYA